MTRILAALRSPGAMMLALVLALIAQGEHTAQVFAYFAHGGNNSAWLLSYAFACAVEVAVLLFVLRGHKLISYAFAGATFCTNLVYYWIGGVALLSVAVLPVLLLSALLPACIVGYSHIIAETPHETPKGKHTTTPLETLLARPMAPQGHCDANAAPADNADEAAADAVPPVAETPPAAAATHKRPRVVRKRKPAKLDATQRRAQIAESGVTDVSAIVAQFGVSLRTAQEDVKQVRAATMAQNGSAHHA